MLTDQVTGAPYYQVELAPNTGGLELLSGMPVEPFLKTNERSTFTYLVKSVKDYFNKAFCEE